MIPVEQIIAQYHQAIAAEESALANKILETLEADDYLNEVDWNKIHLFLKSQNLTGRIELISNRFIASRRYESGRVFLVLAKILASSKRFSEAEKLLKLYPDHRISSDSAMWDYINLLVNLRLFDACLTEVRSALETAKNKFQFKILEIRCLSELGQKFDANQKLSKLYFELEDNSSQWLWFSNIAIEIGQINLSRKAIPKLIDLLQKNRAKLSKNVVHALKKTGFEAEIIPILIRAQTESYQRVEELEEIFEISLHYGVTSAAIKFGKAILAANPSHRLKSKIHAIIQKPEFLMF